VSAPQLGPAEDFPRTYWPPFPLRSARPPLGPFSPLVTPLKFEGRGGSNAYCPLRIDRCTRTCGAGLAREETVRDFEGGSRFWRDITLRGAGESPSRGGFSEHLQVPYPSTSPGVGARRARTTHGGVSRGAAFGSVDGKDRIWDIPKLRKKQNFRSFYPPLVRRAGPAWDPEATFSALGDRISRVPRPSNAPVKARLRDLPLDLAAENRTRRSTRLGLRRLKVVRSSQPGLGRIPRVRWGLKGRPWHDDEEYTRHPMTAPF
jgi:hypothetical protein